jgi:hypothetical protein
MRETVTRLWPEIAWIGNPQLREQVTATWVKAIERSPLKPDDLNQIPFTLLVPNCPITFMEHKRCVVHIARDSARAMQQFMGRALPIDVDTVIAGAILADVGKLLEYELGPDGKSQQSERGEALRHPFTGVALALECGVPDAVWTSLRRTPQKEIWSSGRPRLSSCIMPTSWHFCHSRIRKISS